MTPFPRLPPVDRARAIANSLLALLPDADRALMTTRAHALGETWLGSTLVTLTPDQAITTREAAELLCVGEATIRRWACRPHPEHPDRPLLPRAGRKPDGRGHEQTYLVRNLLDASAAVRRSRAGRRVGAREVA